MLMASMTLWKVKKMKIRVKVLLKTQVILQIEHLVPNLNQPRKDFSTDELNSLASSIEDTGIIQPILVRRNNDVYEIVAGERRWRAAQIAKIHEVPVLIKELTDEEVVKISIIENIQRVDLNPIEEANSYKQLIQDFGYTQGKVSESLGKSRIQFSCWSYIWGCPWGPLKGI